MRQIYPIGIDEIIEHASPYPCGTWSAWSAPMCRPRKYRKILFDKRTHMTPQLSAIRPANPIVALPNPRLFAVVSPIRRLSPAPATRCQPDRMTVMTATTAHKAVGRGDQNNNDTECLAYGKPPAERAQ